MEHNPALLFCLSLSLVGLVLLYIAVGNIRCIEKVFSSDPKDRMNRCFAMVLLNTAWKTGSIVAITCVSAELLSWTAASNRFSSPLHTLLYGGFYGAIAGAVLGFLTALGASLATKLGERATQLVATAVLLGQVFLFVIFQAL